jgi:hypothetical protein
MANSKSTVHEEFVKKPSQVAPTLFVGLGGAGCKMVNRIYKQLSRRPDFQERYKPLCKFAYVDTNIHDLENFREEGDDLFLISDFEKAEYSRLAGGKAYLDADDYFTQWVPQNYRFRSGDTAGAGQIRIESRLGVYYQVKHKDYVLRFRKLIEAMKDHSHGHRKLDSSEIRIVIAYSVAGGTGSGSHLPMAYLLRDLAAQFGKPLVFGVAALSSVFEDKVGTNKDGVFANGYAALKETEYLMKLGAPESKFFPEDGARVFHYNPNDRSRRTVDAKPFDILWVIDRPESFAVSNVLAAAGDALYLQLFTALYGEQAGDFDNYTQHQRFLVPHDFEAKNIPGYTSFYGGLGAAVLHVPDESVLQYCSRRGSLAVIENSFLQGIPPGAIYAAIQSNSDAFYEVDDTRGTGKPVKESDFDKRAESERRRLRNQLFQKRVRMLARCEFDANSDVTFFREVFTHGHGMRALPLSTGAVRRVDLLNGSAEIPQNDLQKLQQTSAELSKEKLGASMAHFVHNALEPAEAGSDAANRWRIRLFEAAKTAAFGEFNKGIAKYTSERSGTETIEKGIVFKSEEEVERTTSRADVEKKVATLQASAMQTLNDLLDRPAENEPTGADWIPGFQWLNRLAFVNSGAALQANLVEKRYAILAVLDQVEPIVASFKEEKNRRDSASKAKAAKLEASAGATPPAQPSEGQDDGKLSGGNFQQFINGLASKARDALEEGLLDALQGRVEALLKSLDAYARVFTDLQSQFEPMRKMEFELAEKLRIGGTKDETEAFILDGEALQIESGRRMWDFYFEDEVRNLSALHLSSNPELGKMIATAIDGLVSTASREEPIPADALSELYKRISASIAGAIRTKIVGDVRSSNEADRHGLTLGDALELEVKYRAIYLTNREKVDAATGGTEAVGGLVSEHRAARGKNDISKNLKLDYFRDKTKRLIKERSDLLCYLDEKHLSQGGVRANEIFLATMHKDLSGMLREVLDQGLGIQPPRIVDKDVDDRKQIIFYRAILNVPLYVFGRLRELRACYYQFKDMAKRSKVLHIDKNWEDTLPDLDPASVEEAHRQQRIRDSVLDFGTLLSVPQRLIFDSYIGDAERAELGYVDYKKSGLLEDTHYGVHENRACIGWRDAPDAGRTWVLRLPLEERIRRVNVGSRPEEIDVEEPRIGSYIGEAVLRAQDILAESPEMFVTYRSTCKAVREGRVPKVIQQLVRMPGEWRKRRESLKTRYGRSPTEEQQRNLEDLDNVQQKLTAALVQLYEVLDLRKRESELQIRPIDAGTGDEPATTLEAGRTTQAELDPEAQAIRDSISLLASFRSSLTERAVEASGPRKQGLFAPLKDPGEAKRVMGRT